MSTGSGHLRSNNLLLWVGLAMISASLVLALAGNLYAARTAADFGPPAGRGGGAPANAPGGGQGQGWGGQQNWGGGQGWNGQGGPSTPTADVGGIADAREAFETAVEGYGNPDLEVAEVMEFANNYYAEVREKGTGVGAMELLIDKPGGQVYPEPGPNMMWNTKYGMMGGSGANSGPMMGPGGRGMMGPNGGGPARNPRASPDGEMSVAPERAREIANAYLERVSPGTEAGEAEGFYGYYTLHTEKDGEITGMLSVNGYSGEVWYHSWHGPFVAMEEEG